MSKFKVGDRVRSNGSIGNFEGTVLYEKEDLTGFLLIQRDDGEGWSSSESPQVHQFFKHLLGLESLWWAKESKLVLGFPKPIFDGYDIDA